MKPEHPIPHYLDRDKLTKEITSKLAKESRLNEEPKIDHYEGFSDFHNLMGFTGKKIQTKIIVLKCFLKV